MYYDIIRYKCDFPLVGMVACIYGWKKNKCSKCHFPLVGNVMILEHFTVVGYVLKDHGRRRASFELLQGKFRVRYVLTLRW